MASVQFVEQFVFADNVLRFLVLRQKFIDALVVDGGFLFSDFRGYLHCST